MKTTQKALFIASMLTTMAFIVSGVASAAGFSGVMYPEARVNTLDCDSIQVTLTQLSPTLMRAKLEPVAEDRCDDSQEVPSAREYLLGTRMTSYGPLWVGKEIGGEERELRVYNMGQIRMFTLTEYPKGFGSGQGKESVSFQLHERDLEKHRNLLK